ncbi:MAG TPA: hypothetical protein VFR99_09495 [Marmoricola sp.]|nr:hypothetical protein [Marmoricola sp.]
MRKRNTGTRAGYALATAATVAAMLTACHQEKAPAPTKPVEAAASAVVAPATVSPSPSHPIRRLDVARKPYPSASALPLAKKPTRPADQVADTGRVTYLRHYVYCGARATQAQRCINQGKLTWYKPAGVNTLAGHNYLGWYWLDDLPVGREVKITAGGLRGTYRVYGHAWVTNGQFPRSGRHAAVALQTCAGRGIGFSFLRRV